MRESTNQLPHVHGWTVVFLSETQSDLAELGRADAGLPARIRAEILLGFHEPFKAQRFRTVLEGGARSGQIDRLEGSSFPKSYRLQVLQHYRATVCVLPLLDTVLVVHLFAKSSDPNYYRAVVEHDRRLETYFLPFKEFVERADQLRRRRTTGRP